jgi:hypothetical protein
VEAREPPGARSGSRVLGKKRRCGETIFEVLNDDLALAKAKVAVEQQRDLPEWVYSKEFSGTGGTSRKRGKVEREPFFEQGDLHLGAVVADGNAVECDHR